MKLVTYVLLFTTVVWPALSSAAELVLYDGRLDDAVETMQAQESLSNGRDFRPFDLASFPGQDNLWISGASATQICSTGGRISRDALNGILQQAEYLLVELDENRTAMTLQVLHDTLACIDETVYPELIARVLFLQGMLAGFANNDKEEIVKSFEKALAVFDLKWDKNYPRKFGILFYETKERVNIWRKSDSVQQIVVHDAFEHDDLMIDGLHDVKTILPGTHLVQWVVDGRWFGRVFEVEPYSAKVIVLTSMPRWRDAMLDGPSNANPERLPTIVAFFDKLRSGENVTMLSLNGELRHGYTFLANAKIEPIMELTIPDRKPRIDANAKRTSKVRGTLGLFGVYALLSRSSYGGVSVLGHVNPVGGLQFGVGGRVIFASYKGKPYMLAGLRLGVRYVFTLGKIAKPFIGAYGVFEFQDPVIAGAEACVGVEFHATDHIRPTIGICGGAGMPGIGRMNLQLGITFH